MERHEAQSTSDTGGARVDRQKAEQQLLVSQLRLEGIVESAMDAIITVNEDQRVVLFNRAAERMFGCSIEDAIGRPLDLFLPASFREAHHHHVHDFGRSGVTSRKMGRLGSVSGLRADGEEFPIEAAISHIVVEGQTYYTVILRDITERRRAEHLLRQSEERYRRLIAISPYAILVNRGNRIIFANDQAIKLFGAVKAEEILEKSPMDLFHADDHDIVRQRIDELFEGGTQVPVLEEKIETLDGRTVEVEVSGARFVDEEGPAILIMLRDVSERKRLQEQLRRTERVAELGTLASGMAHEIGTPMNVILGRAEYLMDRVTEEPIKRGLQTIITQVERITRVMNQLLSFARRKAPRRVPLDLRQVIADSMEMFQERLATNQIRVEMEMAGPCPMVLADADQISQVLLNLIMNALHAMPEGGTLRVGLEQEQAMVKLTIADTGHGIPSEVIRRIYDPFFTTKEFGKGTGLGLTVVKGIIEEHQGSIAVESEEGNGTSFTVLLPMSQEAGC
ncbi:MAG: PAS domain S-box protein [Nitrospira sp.]|nr:PAS domain S-box protein [Nitrospira sp.]